MIIITIITTTTTTTNNNNNNIHQPLNTKQRPSLTFGNLFHQSLLDAVGRIAGGGDSGKASEDDYFIKLGNGAKVLEYDYEGADDNIEMYSYSHL